MIHPDKLTYIAYAATPFAVSDAGDDPFRISGNLKGYYFVVNPSVLVRFFASFASFKKTVVLPLMKQLYMSKQYWVLKTKLNFSERMLKKGNDITLYRNILENRSQIA
jgi:hypothetical protein